MRILLRTSIIIFLLGIFNPLFAQYRQENDGLKTRYRPGIGWFYSGFEPYEEGKLRKYDRLIFDVHYNDWHGDLPAFKSPWHSVGFSFAAMFDLVLTQGNTVAFGIGIGYSYYGNGTKKEYVREFQDKQTNLIDYDPNDIPKASRFGGNYIEIPLDFRFRIPLKKWDYQHIKFIIGGKIGLNVSSFSSETRVINDKNYRTVTYNFPDANLLRYGVTARIGIRNVALYGAYYFSPIFKNQQSTKLNPFEIGLSISLF